MFRATFEDKLLASDIVFLRTWVQVFPHRFYNPVTTPVAATRKPGISPRMFWKAWLGFRVWGLGFQEV